MPPALSECPAFRFVPYGTPPTGHPPAINRPVELRFDGVIREVSRFFLNPSRRHPPTGHRPFPRLKESTLRPKICSKFFGFVSLLPARTLGTMRGSYQEGLAYPMLFCCPIPRWPLGVTRRSKPCRAAILGKNHQDRRRAAGIAFLKRRNFWKQHQVTCAATATATATVTGRGRICDAGSGSSGAAECRFENAYDGEGVGVSREGLLWSLGTGKRHAYASIVSVFT